MAYSRVPGLRDQSGGTIDGGFPFHVNANTTGQQISYGPCYLDAVVVGKSGSTDWTVTIYDGTSTAGTVVGVFDFNAGGTYQFNCIFEVGIFITAAFASTGTVVGDVTFIVIDPSKV